MVGHLTRRSSLVKARQPVPYPVARVGSLAANADEQGILVLYLGLLSGLPLVLESDTRVFDAPPLIEV